MDRLIVVEKLTYVLYLEYKTKIIVVTFGMDLFLCTNSCNFDNIQISYTFSLNIRHEIIQLIQSHS